MPPNGAGDEEKGLSWVEFKGNEMVDLIAYIRSFSSKMEKVYLSPGDPQNGKKLFTQKDASNAMPQEEVKFI